MGADNTEFFFFYDIKPYHTKAYPVPESHHNLDQEGAMLIFHRET
jgi:hypothetical protein